MDLTCKPEKGLPNNLLDLTLALNPRLFLDFNLFIFKLIYLLTYLFLNKSPKPANGWWVAALFSVSVEVLPDSASV